MKQHLFVMSFRRLIQRETLRLQYDSRIGQVRTYTAIVEHCAKTGLYVGHVPGFPGAHSQGASLDELRANLQEVVQMLVEDGEPVLETEFAGIQTIVVN